MSVKFGTPTEEQLAKINKLSKRPLTETEVFAFSGKSAGDMMIPNRYTKISKELLEVMVDDAKKGVSFMFNHNWSSRGGIQGIPYGKVFDGRLEPSGEANETVGLYLDKYIVRDDEISDGISANALIKRIETGVLSDTSITFSTDTMVCSICGMNYYSRDCSHWRGNTYEMSDGTKKVCTLTAMPPSVIIPYNNNALYEESIVWDGAYPGAVVTQSKHGDVIELPTGNFVVVQDKEEFPNDTVFLSKYHNGDILTLVKKSDHKKIYSLDGKNPKEGEKMNEEVLAILTTFGIDVEEGKTLSVEEIKTLLTEKFKADNPPAELENTPEYLSKEKATEALGKEMSADEVLKFAKEGIAYHKQVAEDAIAMGVKAMGNDFPAETWKNTFATMGTDAIKDIAKTWQTQAENSISTGRLSEPKGEGEKQVDYPDEAFKVGK